VTWVFLYPGLLCVCQGLERTGWLLRQTALFQEPPHQQACNNHVRDVFDSAQAHLFFLLPPSTTTPSAPPLLPVPQLRATSSSKHEHTQCLALLKNHLPARRKAPVCLRMAVFRVYPTEGQKGCFLFFPLFSLPLLLFLPQPPPCCPTKNSNKVSSPFPERGVWTDLEDPG